jgi:hypothetical protein
MYGSSVPVKQGYPPILHTDLNPDKQVISLTGTFWW